MKHELRRVAPLRAANVAAIVYGILMGLVALIFLPFVLLMTFLQPTETAGATGFAGVMGVFVLVVYPVMGAVMGWIMGLVSAATYNLIVRWTGGLVLDLQPVQGEPGPPAAPYYADTTGR